jgi:hypothetical protein
LLLTSIQTHRDHFSVDFDKDNIHKKMEDLRNASISDDVLRERYDLKDNRDWKLPNARSKLQIGSDWERRIINCLYRPFDWRPCFFSEIIMDLIALYLRQVEKQIKYSHFIFIRMIKSKIRTKADYWRKLVHCPAPMVTPNLNPDFVSAFASRLGLTFVSDGHGDLASTRPPTVCAMPSS